MIKVTTDFSAKLGSARDQQKRGMCLAFAASDFNQYANQLPDSLSVEYLAHHAVAQSPGWAKDHGLNFGPVLLALANPGQPVEAAYPYNPGNAGWPLETPPANVGNLYTCNVSQLACTPKAIVTALGNGHAVCLGMALSSNWWVPVSGVIEYIPTYIPDALHAVLAVGLGVDDTSNEHYVWIRNSWGTAWAEQGHAWLSAKYLETHLHSSFAL